MSGDHDHFFKLGAAYQAAGETRAAALVLDKVLTALDPQASTLNNTALRMAESGWTDGAQAVFEAALALAPNDAAINTNLGNQLRHNGDTERARVHYTRAVKSRPDLPEAIQNLAFVHPFKADDWFAKLIFDQLAQTPPDDTNALARLHYSAAKYHDTIKNWDTAFVHYITSGRAYRAAIGAKPVNYSDLAKAATLVTPPLATLPAPPLGNPSRVPIFVVGMLRSGTTLIETILAAHPQVHPGGERNLLVPAMEPHLHQLAMAPSVSAASRDLPQIRQALAACGQSYLDALRTIAPAAHHITDKLPLNAFHIGAIRLILPNAKIILVNRDPLDTCVSCFQNYFADGHEWSYDLEQLGRFYNTYRATMNRWRATLAGQFLEVDYQDLTENPEPNIRRILDHCGLDWDDRCLNFHQSQRVVTTVSAEQVRQPMYTSSVGRWRRYSAHLDPLRAVLAEGDDQDR